jgi:WD repeat-containing protein 48
MVNNDIISMIDKLWSLLIQQRLHRHIFTHYTESHHPSLEIFYSGNRSGIVSRVNMENCCDISDGECIVLCNDSPESTRPSQACDGMNNLKIVVVVLVDHLLWTANSGTSSIGRWDIP